MAISTVTIRSFLICGSLILAESRADAPFKIMVVDSQTGRGVPLVQLTTTNELVFYTDSNGIAAVDEPGLMGQEVYFHVGSHGYEYPKDGFGYRGTRLKVKRGESAQVTVERLNVAERLYRVTGAGIYRDSVLVGHAVPIDEPVINGQVMGQDSALATLYRGKIFWVWGDTNRPSYPLGNFGVSAAESDLPPPLGQGLDPAVGVNLRYFVSETGFSRSMVSSDAVPGPGAKWLSGLVTIPDPRGQERLIAKYIRVKSLTEKLEQGVVVFNDQTSSFDRLVQIDLDANLFLDGHPFRATVPILGDSTKNRASLTSSPADSAEYFYCGYSVPYGVRVRSNWSHVTDPSAYEGFSPLQKGARYDRSKPPLDRDSDGRLRYSWKSNTAPLSYDQMSELIESGYMKRDEAWLALEDIESGKPIKPHAGSVRWNEYRQRWVMIVQQAFGTSNFGEIWYAEADTPIGPWVYARKIVTHEKYSFYNPVHHAFFDQCGGRMIYFEGTYSDLFSGSPAKTPRYDYNQIMYRLTLDDPRLSLPSPVYEVRGSHGGAELLLREDVDTQQMWDRVENVAFFAVAPNRPRTDLIPVYGCRDGRRFWLQNKLPDAGGTIQSRVLFYALPPDASGSHSPAVCSLVEHPDATRDSGPGYRVEAQDNRTSEGSTPPICRVWRNPMSLLILDRGVRPVKE